MSKALLCSCEDVTTSEVEHAIEKGFRDLESVKRAYRKLARALHPDLQPTADAQRRRTLERRFAEVTAAYEVLL